jgi:hypothetical protein
MSKTKELKSYSGWSVGDTLLTKYYGKIHPRKSTKYVIDKIWEEDNSEVYFSTKPHTGHHSIGSAQKGGWLKVPSGTTVASFVREGSNLVWGNSDYGRTIVTNASVSKVGKWRKGMTIHLKDPSDSPFRGDSASAKITDIDENRSTGKVRITVVGDKGGTVYLDVSDVEAHFRV